MSLQNAYTTSMYALPRSSASMAHETDESSRRRLATGRAPPADRDRRLRRGRHPRRGIRRVPGMAIPNGSTTHPWTTPSHLPHDRDLDDPSATAMEPSVHGAHGG